MASICAAGAMGLAVIGTIGRLRQFVRPAGASTPGDAAVATPHSGFAADAPADDSAAPAINPQLNAQPWYLSPRFLSLGGSVLGGFLIGWAMRLFIKTTLLIGLAATALLGVLSHTRIMNVDFTSVQQQYSGDFSWLSDQASRLKDVAIAHLPVHAGGLLGMFLGFRRPRM